MIKKKNTKLQYQHNKSNKLYYGLKRRYINNCGMDLINYSSFPLRVKTKQSEEDWWMGQRKEAKGMKREATIVLGI